MLKTSTLKFFGCIIFLCLSIAGYSQIPQNGLIGHYQLDGNAADSSTYGHHGIIKGNVTAATDRHGHVGKACSFNGGFIDAGNPVPYQITGEISISIWIQPTTIGFWDAIVTKWEGFGVGSFFLGINPGNQAVRWNVDNPMPVEGTDSIKVNEWTHIVATYDKNFAKIYENGVLVNQEAYTQDLGDVLGNLLIGAQFNDTTVQAGQFQGLMDDVLIYDRALDATEVAIIYGIPATSTKDVSIFENLKVFPNPTRGIINIEYDGYEAIQYTIFDSKGARLLSEQYQGSANIGHLPPGMYLVMINIDNQVTTRKILLH